MSSKVATRCPRTKSLVGKVTWLLGQLHEIRQEVVMFVKQLRLMGLHFKDRSLLNLEGMGTAITGRLFFITCPKEKIIPCAPKTACVYNLLYVTFDSEVSQPLDHYIT